MFAITNMEFENGAPSKITFEFGPFEMTVELELDVALREAMADAADRAASDLQDWATEAKAFAATLRNTELRTVRRL